MVSDNKYNADFTMGIFAIGMIFGIILVFVILHFSASTHGNLYMYQDDCREWNGEPEIELSTWLCTFPEEIGTHDISLYDLVNGGNDEIKCEKQTLKE